MLRLVPRALAGALLCLATTFLPAVLRAQDGIVLSGIVTDDAGRPIEGVAVAVVELSRSTATAADGRYRLAHLLPGTYRVSFQRLGFRPEIRPVTLAASLGLDVSLRTAMVELPPVQVSATASPTTALQSPQPVAVLDGDALREAMSLSLGETVRSLPGVRNWSTGSGVGKPMIRGLRNDRVLVLADGQRTDFQGWGDEHGPQVESADAERIEVIRGPASVLYGSDALGGVVNVIPRELPTAFGTAPFVRGRVTGGWSSNGSGRDGRVSFEGAQNGLGVRGSLTGRTHDDLETPGGALFNSGYDAVTGALEAGVRGDWGAWQMRYTRRDETVRIHEDPAEEEGATPNQAITDDLLHVSVLMPVGGGRVEWHGGWQRNDRREFEEADADEVALGLLARTWSAGVHWHHAPFGRWQGLFGASLQRERFTRSGEEALVPGSRALDFGLFVFEETEAGPWRLSLGARYDHRELDAEDDPALGVTGTRRTYDALSGNLGLLHRLGDPAALVVNLGRGFRAPSHFDLFSNGVHEGTVAFERGDPSLSVETSLNADLALRVQTGRLHGEVGGFVHRISDFIYSRPTGTFDDASGFQILDVVQGDATLAGFEASVDLHLSQPLHVTASADWVRGRNTVLDQPLPWIPPVRFEAGLRWEGERAGALHHPHLSVTGEWNARQEDLDPDDFATDAYTLLHVAAGAEAAFGRRTLALELVVRNLLDERHRDFLSRYKAYADAPGRDVRLQVSAGF
jgi:outer membrane receptor protein involved in Fe transport